MDNNKTLSEIDQLIKQGDLSNAKSLCEQLNNQSINNEEILLRRASIAHLQENTKEAISHLVSVLKLNNNSVIALSNIAALYEQSRELDKAKRCYEQLYRLTPDSHDSLKNLAFFLYDNSYVEEARQCLRKLITTSPFNATAHFAYSRTGVYDRSDITLKHLQDGVSDLPKKPSRDHIKYAFTMAKANHDIGEYQAAFKAYSQANNMHISLYPDSLQSDLNLLSDVKAQFGIDSPWPKDQWQQVNSKEHPTPIFIVGMPRTGSTLLEQLIGAHSQVGLVGETNFLFKAIQKHLIEDHETLSSAAPHWTSTNFKNAAQDYLQNISSHNNNATYVIDKMPGNFAFLGIIHLLFPNAKVIVTRRNAMDVIWSNYSTLFDQDLLLYSYDLEDLTKYYIAQEQTVDYWQKLLPESSMKINIHESLVEQTRSNLESLLSYLDLTWEENCLNSHDLNSTIKTASHIQVKQPINKSGFDRWKNYSEELEPIKNYLSKANILVD